MGAHLPRSVKGEGPGAALRAAEPGLLSEPTEAGEQTLVPGVRPLSERDRLALRAAAPLAPTKLQRPLDFGLFDLAARNQFDLFDARRSP